MVWERLARWILFGAGMFCGIEAGRLFYLDRASTGGAFLLMAGMFLFFATGNRGRAREKEPMEAEGTAAGDLPEVLALFVAEEALNGLKRIGRTMPPSPMEIAQLEDKLDAILSCLNASSEDRARLNEEIEKLKGRARQDEGRRALIRSSRL